MLEISVVMVVPVVFIVSGGNLVKEDLPRLIPLTEAFAALNRSRAFT